MNTIPNEQNQSESRLNPSSSNQDHSVSIDVNSLESKGCYSAKQHNASNSNAIDTSHYDSQLESLQSLIDQSEALEQSQNADDHTADHEVNFYRPTNDLHSTESGENVVNSDGNSHTVFFDGKFEDFIINEIGDGRFEVIGPNGIDTISSVSYLQFDDGVVPIDDLCNVDSWLNCRSDVERRWRESTDTVITIEADGSVKVVGPEGVDFIQNQPTDVSVDSEDIFAVEPEITIQVDSNPESDESLENETASSAAEKSTAALADSIQAEDLNCDFMPLSEETQINVCNPDAKIDEETDSQTLISIDDTPIRVDGEPNHEDSEDHSRADLFGQTSPTGLSERTESEPLDSFEPCNDCLGEESQSASSLENEILHQPIAESNEQTAAESNSDATCADKLDIECVESKSEMCKATTARSVAKLLESRNETLRRTVVSFAGATDGHSVTAIADVVAECDGVVIDFTSRKLGRNGELMAGFLEVEISAANLEKFNVCTSLELPTLNVSCHVVDALLEKQD